jgi:hypothetical protein
VVVETASGNEAGVDLDVPFQDHQILDICMLMRSLDISVMTIPQTRVLSSIDWATSWWARLIGQRAGGLD